MQAVELQSVFGLSDAFSTGVLDMSDDKQKKVCYAASHMVIISSHEDSQQTVLQGHQQPVSCLTVSADKSVIASADCGYDSLVVLWDAQTGTPFWSVSKPHDYGIQAMQLTSDCRQLIAMSALSPGGALQQCVSIWDISKPTQKPTFVAYIPAGEQKFCLHLNRNNQELITNGQDHVCFWAVTSTTVALATSPTRSMEFKRATGNFTTSSYLPDGCQAATGSYSGEIVLWSPWIAMPDGKRMRKATKIISIHSSPVFALSTTDDFLVSGAGDGFIRFFDNRLRLAAWFEDLNAGPVRSLSFSRVRPTRPAVSASGEADFFAAPDFVMGSTTGNIVAVRSSNFEQPDDQPSHRLLVQGVVDHATAMVTHPTKPLFIVAGRGGVLQTWDMLIHALVKTHQLPTPTPITCMAFSHDGTIVATGSAVGVVRICKEGDFEAIADFRPVRQAISHMDFSSNGRQLALGFKDASVAMIAHMPWKGGGHRWELVGSLMPHPGPTSLAGLAYGEAPSGVTKLFSLGKDGSIAEYEVEKVSPGKGLRLLSLHSLASQAAVTSGPSPTALTFAPPLPYFAQGSADLLLLVADEAHKLRIYNADTHTCVSTAVGPLHGGHIISCRVFRALASDSFFVAYSTADHVVGVMAWPLDGDPSKSLGLVAHPGRIAGMNLSHDGCKLVTAGADDGSIMVWRMDSEGLEAKLGGQSQPRTPLQVLVDIEGPGSTFQQDATDYFCLAQLTSQSSKSLDVEVSCLVGGKVSVDQIISLCQSLGYYPADEEVQEMLEELAYQARSRQDPTPTHVDLQQFLALYLNYRPAMQEPSDEVSQAFAALGADPTTGTLSRDDLVKALTEYGEPLPHEEMVSCIETLTGSREVLDVLPADVTASDFASGLLGFENALDSEPAQISAGA